MEDFVLGSGISPDRVRRIPIAVNTDYFPVVTPESKRAARLELGLPLDAAIVGSFQKDGVGWGNGMVPKAIKGPDVLIDVCAKLHEAMKGIHVLLSGAARGFVRSGLAARKVPHTYCWVNDYRRIATLYHACDLVLVTSREEGGPKAVLESLAAGVPLVSTAVGQAPDLVRHGETGWIAPVDSVEELVVYSQEALLASQERRVSMRVKGRLTAEANTYQAQRPLWRDFFQWSE
jgi:glycosyltransferase involved in cell wall biosynthesis